MLDLHAVLPRANALQVLGRDARRLAVEVDLRPRRLRAEGERSERFLHLHGLEVVIPRLREVHRLADELVALLPQLDGVGTKGEPADLGAGGRPRWIESLLAHRRREVGRQRAGQVGDLPRAAGRGGVLHAPAGQVGVDRAAVVELDVVVGEGGAGVAAAAVHLADHHVG